MISAFDLGWLVGLIEGEGSFCIPYKATKGRARAGVTITQKDAEILHRARSILGFGRIGTDGHACMRWTVVGPRAVGLAMTLYPNMSQKRKAQIRRMLDHWRTAPVQPGKTWKNAGKSNDYFIHGTMNAYINHGCRCAPCRAVMSRANRAAYDRRVGRDPGWPQRRRGLMRQRYYRLKAAALA